jgi:hypothetical protein
LDFATNGKKIYKLNKVVVHTGKLRHVRRAHFCELTIQLVVSDTLRDQRSEDPYSLSPFVRCYRSNARKNAARNTRVTVCEPIRKIGWNFLTYRPKRIVTFIGIALEFCISHVKIGCNYKKRNGRYLNACCAMQLDRFNKRAFN